MGVGSSVGPDHASHGARDGGDVGAVALELIVVEGGVDVDEVGVFEPALGVGLQFDQTTGGRGVDGELVCRRVAMQGKVGRATLFGLFRCWRAGVANRAVLRSLKF